jgi:hypothetical protein
VAVTYPLRGEGHLLLRGDSRLPLRSDGDLPPARWRSPEKRKHEDDEPEAGTSKFSEQCKKKHRNEEKTLPRDDSSIRKYSSHNIRAPLGELFGNHLEKREDFSKDQTQKIMKLISVF